MMSFVKSLSSKLLYLGECLLTLCLWARPTRPQKPQAYRAQSTGSTELLTMKSTPKPSLSSINLA
eukprot:scaffold185125_cov50-Cyclotella_meneghiniana.AAC.2